MTQTMIKHKCDYMDCRDMATHTLGASHHGEWLIDCHYCDKHTELVLENYFGQIKSYYKIKS